ncbi:MAG TPA: PHP domain-containing protein [Chloroflexota bacterium]|nr:PHP domain-containing protein [Chloroflexota bacterium]
MNTKVDLHAHTTASDGLLTPSELVELALAYGLRLLAITDHDSTEGVAAALNRAAGTSLEVWPGVEISTDVPRAEVHMLGYFVDIEDSNFQEVLSRCRDSRIWRAQQMVLKLGELGMSLTFERVRQIAGTGSIGRPHVAQALVEKGYVSNLKEAFDLYLNRNGPAYVERFKLSPVEAVQLIKNAGGMPVLAHPTYINPGDGSGFDLSGFVHELTQTGLVGMECHYGDYSPETVRGLSKIAREFDLIPTGGSDFHGRGVHSADLGEPIIPDESIERMRAWRAAQ